MQNSVETGEANSVEREAIINEDRDIKIITKDNPEYFILQQRKEDISVIRETQIETEVIKALDSCDLIVCNNGNEINAKVLEIGLAEIKYKKCDNPNGPTISIKKADVLMIKYPNGTKDIIKSSASGNSSSKNENNGPKSNPLALTSMILGVLSLLTVISYFMIAMGIVAIILGVVANKQTKENPDNYTPGSSKLAKAGICAIVGLGILLLFLLL